MVQTKVAEDGLSSPFEADPEILRKIGLVVSLWGGVSHIVRSFVANELGCSQVQADIPLQQFNGEDHRLIFAKNLISLRDPKPTDRDALEALEALRSIAGTRNIIVHGGPVYGGKKGVRPMGYYFVDFRDRHEDQRYRPAMQLLDSHIPQLRERAGVLWDVVYGELALTIPGVAPPPGVGSHPNAG